MTTGSANFFILRLRKELSCAWIMNYEDLRRFERLEKGSSKLVELDKDFYLTASELVRHYQAKAKSSAEDRRTLENVVKILKSIFEHREQKLLVRALHDARVAGQDFTGMTLEEQRLATGISKALRDAREDFEAVLLGEKKPAAADIKDIPEVGRAEPDTVLIRLLKKTPKFVSSGLEEYGPFEVNEIARLPRREAELLFSKSLAEQV